MKKYLLVAALACCSAIAQAGIVKDYFTELCARTETEPMVKTTDQMNGKAIEAGVDTVKIAPIADKAKALALAESWDQSKLVTNIEQGSGNAIKVFAEPIENTDNVECLIMIDAENSPLLCIYLEGNTQILESFSESI